MLIKIKRLKPEAKLPHYAHPGDVGLDLYSLEDYELKPNETHIFMLGFALEFDHGFAAIAKDRSSLALRGLHVLGGVYDAGYRGEYCVILTNISAVPYKIETNHKIAQLIIHPIITAKLTEVNELSASQRGAGRLGSTGK